MDSVFQSNVSGTPPGAGTLVAGFPQAGAAPTVPGPYWFHMVTQELLAVINAASITPAYGSLTQVRDAVYVLAVDAPYSSGATYPAGSVGARLQALAALAVGITTLTGDVSASGSGSVVASLAPSGVNAGTYPNPVLTIDSKGRVTAATNGTPVAASVTGSYAPDASAHNNFNLTLTGNLTLANPTGLSAGMRLNICLDQDATGGHSITLGSLYKFDSGVVPAWSTAANGTNFLSAYYDGVILRCTGGKAYA